MRRCSIARPGRGYRAAGGVCRRPARCRCCGSIAASRRAASGSGEDARGLRVIGVVTDPRLAALVRGGAVAGCRSATGWAGRRGEHIVN